MSEWGRGVGGPGWGVTEGSGDVPGALTGAGFSGRRKVWASGHRIHSGCGFSRRKQGARSWAGSQDRSPREEGEGTRPGEGPSAQARPRDPPEAHGQCGQTGHGARLLPQRTRGWDKREWAVCWLGAWWVEGARAARTGGGCRKERGPSGRVGGRS